jgi:hypothetical protein
MCANVAQTTYLVGGAFDDDRILRDLDEFGMDVWRKR